MKKQFGGGPAYQILLNNFECVSLKEGKRTVLSTAPNFTALNSLRLFIPFAGTASFHCYRL